MALRSAFLASALTAIVAIVLVAPPANAVADCSAEGSDCHRPRWRGVIGRPVRDGDRPGGAASAAATRSMPPSPLLLRSASRSPTAPGIGGGGFFVYYDARSGKVHTIDGRETAPSAMEGTRSSSDGLPIPFAEAVTSGLSVGVPGTPATWELALDRWGSIDLKQALRPAAQLATGDSSSTRPSSSRLRTTPHASPRSPAPGSCSSPAVRHPRSARCCATRTWLAPTPVGPARNRLSLRGAPWRGHRRDGDAAAGRAGVHAHRPARPHAPARPGRVPRPAQGTHADRLPRADRCRDGTAVLRRLDGR